MDSIAALATTRSLVPSRLLDPQALRGPRPPSGGLLRFGAVLVACALAGVGAGHLLPSPSSSPAVVADVRRERLAPTWDDSPAYQGLRGEIRPVSAGGFGDRGLFE
jgi:hypothetical protein